MSQTLDRSKCRWRGYHVETVERALQTGEPAFKFRKYNAKCPTCGVLFKRTSNHVNGYCSPSCGLKGSWKKRRKR